VYLIIYFNDTTTHYSYKIEI